MTRQTNSVQSCILFPVTCPFLCFKRYNSGTTPRILLCWNLEDIKNHTVLAPNICIIFLNCMFLLELLIALILLYWQNLETRMKHYCSLIHLINNLINTLERSCFLPHNSDPIHGCSDAILCLFLLYPFHSIFLLEQQRFFALSCADFITMIGGFQL